MNYFAERAGLGLRCPSGGKFGSLRRGGKLHLLKQSWHGGFSRCRGTWNERWGGWGLGNGVAQLPEDSLTSSTKAVGGRTSLRTERVHRIDRVSVTAENMFVMAKKLAL